MSAQIPSIQEILIKNAATTPKQGGAASANADEIKSARKIVTSHIFMGAGETEAQEVLQRLVPIDDPFFLIDATTYAIAVLADRLINNTKRSIKELVDLRVRLFQFSTDYFLSVDWLYTQSRVQNALWKKRNPKLMNSQRCEEEVATLLTKIERLVGRVERAQQEALSDLKKLLLLTNKYASFENNFLLKEYGVPHIMLEYPFEYVFDGSRPVPSIEESLLFLSDYCAKFYLKLGATIKDFDIGRVVYKELKLLLNRMVDEQSVELIRQFEEATLNFSIEHSTQMECYHTWLNLLSINKLNIQKCVEYLRIKPRSKNESMGELVDRLSEELIYRLSLSSLLVQSTEYILKIFHKYIVPVENRFEKRQNAPKLRAFLTAPLDLLSGSIQIPPPPKEEDVPKELHQTNLRKFWLSFHRKNLEKLFVEAKTLESKGSLQLDKVELLCKELDKDSIDPGIWQRTRLTLTPFFSFLNIWAQEIGDIVEHAESEFIEKVRDLPSGERQELVEFSSEWMFEQKKRYQGIIDLLCFERFLLLAVHDNIYPEPADSEYDLMFLKPIQRLLNAFDSELLFEKLHSYDTKQSTSVTAYERCRPYKEHRDAILQVQRAAAQNSPTIQKGEKVKTRSPQPVICTGGAASAAAATPPPVKPASVNWRRGTKTNKLLTDLYGMGYKPNRQKGDHLILTNVKGYSVTVPVGRKEQKVGTLSSIAKQADRGNDHDDD